MAHRGERPTVIFLLTTTSDDVGDDSQIGRILFKGGEGLPQVRNQPT